MRGTGSSFTLGDDRFVPIFDVNNVFQEQGSLTWTKGAHNIKMGASLIRRQLNYYQNTLRSGILPVHPRLAAELPESWKISSRARRTKFTGRSIQAAVFPLLGARYLCAG